ncbi:MAG: 30S ribosomal protein S12 methylthiotransferase RimO [Bacteroidales bacterium]|nr:30S ribosomal protein S12 methylthiotransferase RimO [Bacteroidales bacterium]
MNKINITTLGCSKNLVDSEHLATHLKKNNFTPIFDGNINDAQIVIINTCGFINDAKQESIDTILDFAEAKSRNKINKIFVMGCLTERYKNEIIKEIPEIDGVFGVNDMPKIVAALNSDFKTELYGQRIISTPNHYAYLKIAEGCNRKCSFCAIPAIRGKHISEPIEKLITEAKYIVNKGVKEILLISQDTSFYGKDLYNNFELRNLLDQIIKIDKLEWIRLHYLYPANHLEPILKLMADSPKICNYIDIPFQHISNSILKSMNRGHDADKIKQNIELFRKIVPDVALRTTMIVGYPGETEKDFQDLLDFVQFTKFDRLGAFTYSEEEGTPAAKLEDNVPDVVKQERLDELMLLQSEISLEKNKQKIGKTLKVIIDKQDDDVFIGRTEYDSPEVDNEVIIPADQNLKIGDFYNVNITNAQEFDLYAQIVD